MQLFVRSSGLTRLDLRQQRLRFIRAKTFGLGKQAPGDDRHQNDRPDKSDKRCHTALDSDLDSIMNGLQSESESYCVFMTHATEAGGTDAVRSWLACARAHFMGRTPLVTFLTASVPAGLQSRPRWNLSGQSGTAPYLI